tara:strand:- start:38457 stop:39356 length:900 start_codon:yes stop_codon:yes gene_type:complete
MKKLLILTLFTLTINCANYLQAQERKSKLPAKLKTSLNAFSFNIPLAIERTMNLDDLLEYCASREIDAVDITAYYFPTYPTVPSDEFLYNLKRKAFALGVEISGTGVRNDFTNPDPKMRRESVQLVKNWIVAAEKIGVPVIRIFSGVSDVSKYTREEVTAWLVKDIQECVAFGKEHGVVVAIQNHHDFIANAEHVIDIIEKVDSDWFGLILDTGSYWEGDSYAQIEKTVKYAVNWQVKTMVYMDGKEENADLERILRIIKDSGYRGYVPIETIAKGNPIPLVDEFIGRIKKILEKISKD